MLYVASHCTRSAASGRPSTQSFWQFMCSIDMQQRSIQKLINIIVAMSNKTPNEPFD